MIETSTENIWPSPVELCRKYGIEANKNLGQNFLISSKALQEISGFFTLGEEAFILEIGPGLGHLSVHLLQQGCDLLALEIDERFRSILQAVQDHFENFDFEIVDALKINWNSYISPSRSNYLFGNLPYNLSTEFFYKALTEFSEAMGMAFLLQKETVQRLTSPHGHKEYGPASVLATLYGKVSYGSKLKGGAFYPPPEAESRIVFLQAEPDSGYRKMSVDARKDFLCFLQTVFMNRRKTLRNNLYRMNQEAASVLEQRFAELFSLRPEQIEAKDWMILYNAYRETCRNE